MNCQSQRRAKPHLHLFALRLYSNSVRRDRPGPVRSTWPVGRTGELMAALVIGAWSGGVALQPPPSNARTIAIR